MSFRFVQHKIFLIFFLLISSEAVATDGNPQILPLGENEAFMANTGLAEIGSSGSVFFNPGALVTLKGSKISLSGVAYVLFNYKIDAAYHVDNTDLPYTASGFNGVPFSVVSIAKKGDWILAASVFETEMQTYENQMGWETTNTEIRLFEHSNLNELWIGGSAARQINENTGVGLSAFVVRRNDLFQRSLYVNSKISPTTDGDASTTTITTHYLGLVFLAGVYQKLSDDLGWGARLRVPTFQISGTLDISSIEQSVSSGVLTKNDVNLNGVEGNYKLPADLSVGGNYRVTSNLRVLADVGYQLGVEYEVINKPSVVSRKLQPTLRFNAGAEYQLSENASLRAGFFANPSAKAALQDEEDSREDFYNFSFGYQFTEDHLNTGIGGFYQWSKGEAIPARDVPDLSARTLVSTQIYGAMITTGYAF